MERTLAIIKPDAVAAGHCGVIVAAIEAAGFRLAGARLRHFTRAEAEAFYAVHRAKSFFKELIDFMISGPCLTLLLERPNAVEVWRETLLPLREAYGTDLTRNAVHGSDAADTAATEIGLLFGAADLV